MKVIESPSCKDRSTPSIKIDRNLPVLYTQVHPAVPSQSHSPKQGFQVSPARILRLLSSTTSDLGKNGYLSSTISVLQYCLS